MKKNFYDKGYVPASSFSEFPLQWQSYLHRSSRVQRVQPCLSSLKAKDDTVVSLGEELYEFQHDK